MMTRPRTPLPLSLLSLLATPVALAAGFDATTGKVSTDGAAYALSFDNAGAIQGQGISGYDLINERPFDEIAIAGRIEQLDESGLEGSGALGAGGDLHYVSINFGGPALDGLVGQRVRVVLWQKPQGTRVTPSMTWYAGDFAVEPTFVGSISFQPTGNVTSDGWEEWTSGPVDWAWAGTHRPISVDLVDEAVVAAYGGAWPDEESRALVDALYIEDLGPALVPAVECALPTESLDCGDAGLCHMGFCVDGAIRAGQTILNDELRADYVDRRVYEVDTFEGGRAPQNKVDLLRAALAPLKQPASAATFWPTLAHAYTLLVDGHASAPLVSYPTFQNAGVCVHEGEADLLPGAPIVPLVFQAADNLVGASLLPGDALVAVDGLPTAEWTALATRLVTHPGDPEGFSVVTAPQVFSAAVDAGAVVTFHRCAGPAACDASTVQEIVIDLGEVLGAPVRAGQTVLSYDESAECDYRFVRPVSGEPGGTRNTAYEFAGHSDTGGIRTVVINGVPGYYGQGGEEWFAAVDDALDDQPGLVLLDERTGGGGGVDAMDFIGSYLTDPADLLAMDFLPGFEDDELAPSRDAVIDCSTSQQQSGLGCGNGFRWFVGDASDGTHGAAAGAKLAVLIAMDVSGNDYLTTMLRARPAESTRVFGAGATWGAYGVIWGMAAHLGELSGGSLQVQDTIFVADDGDANTTFLTSTGERPDVIVRQKQSDAVAGRDTVIEAARAWLQETP